MSMAGFLKQAASNAGGTNSILYWIGVLFVVCFSFLYYAPCNYALYNSDHAIHVLMAADFQLPRDLYYWGQDRLGSLLPMCAHWLGYILPIHPLYLCSIVQYLFLGTGFLILSSFLQNRPLKIALCALIFLPVNEYNGLILIGHPYASQLFAGSLFAFFLVRLRRHILMQEINDSHAFIKATVLGLGAVLFFLLGIWASEFSAVLAVLPLFYLAFDKELRDRILKQLRSAWFLLSAGLSVLAPGGAVVLYKWMKGSALVTDDIYQKQFIDNGADLAKNFGFFMERLKTTLLFRDPFPFENLFNWTLLVLGFTMIAAFFLKKRMQRPGLARQINFLLLMSILSCIALFFSTWNLRSSFCPRYFIPVYVTFCFALFLFLDGGAFKKIVAAVVSVYFVLNGLAYCYNNVISKKLPGPFEAYAEFNKLPEGTLIGDYWDVYRINSIALHLKSIPYETQTVRNLEFREDVLKNRTFYFLDKWPWPPGGLRDTIIEYRYFFKNSGVKYQCAGTEVRAYAKLGQEPLTKFALRSSDSTYVGLDPESARLLTAERDPSQAAVFELVQTRVGVALKAPNGKFVCADLSQNAALFARSNDPWAWEMFQLVAGGGNSLQLIATNGKYVSADKGMNGALIANRDEAKGWETFFLEPR